MADSDSKTAELPRAIGKPATRALASIGVTRLKQLTRHRRDELLALHGFGPKAMRELDRAMAEEGLEFKA